MKRAAIVFESRDGVRFDVRLDGVSFAECQRMTDEERREKLDAVSFWCYETFARGVLPLLAASGVIAGASLVRKWRAGERVVVNIAPGAHLYGTPPPLGTKGLVVLVQDNGTIVVECANGQRVMVAASELAPDPEAAS